MFLTQRVHLFPFRTQKLSSVVPKILAWRRAGKIGKRQHSKPGGDSLSIVSAEAFIHRKISFAFIGIFTKANRGGFAKQNAVIDRKRDLGH